MCGRQTEAAAELSNISWDYVADADYRYLLASNSLANLGLQMLSVAVSFVSADTEAHFRLIEKRHDIDLPREQIAGFEAVETAAPVSSATDTVNGGIKGKRKSKKDKLREAAARAAGE